MNWTLYLLSVKWPNNCKLLFYSNDTCRQVAELEEVTELVVENRAKEDATVQEAADEEHLKNVEKEKDDLVEKINSWNRKWKTWRKIVNRSTILLQ